ncbi:hypothetical protein [Sinisalibacter aestuarii]|uniref:Alpha/beta hydrolase n=1 Tax=Sinisalibacter aestuarii TaxID=2949426 RepID=A0ABQ5LP21_9RHOB|nr:hypothetical protein [Sinisalibacter aestuarii]GKY86747.1 alpha/beta hydrolase [Sinisalibacter aestuarii]
MTPRFIFDGEHLRATALGDHPDKLIITFDHWARDKDGFAPVRRDSSYVDKGFSHLHIATNRNDWFLNRDLPGALDAIAGFAAGYRRAVSLAFSMGGYGALLVSRVVTFRQVLLVSPHSTYAQDFPPFDDRFETDIADPDFAAAAHAAILDGKASKAACTVLYDSSMPFDTDHAEVAGNMFRNPRRIDLEGGGHPATRLLTDNNRFGMIMKAITADDLDVSRIEAQHARYREAQRAG